MSSQAVTTPVVSDHNFAMVHFAAGEADATLIIDGLTDSANEGEEDFAVEVVAGIGVNWESANAPTVTLFDLDRSPDAFNFAAKTDVEKSTLVTSEPATISGIEAAVAISVSGGEYSVGCTGTFTSAAGTISNGQTVCVRHTSSATQSTTTNTTLTVGDLSTNFSSTTKADPVSGGGGTGGGNTGGGTGDSGGGGGGGSTGLLTLMIGALALAARRKQAKK